MKKQNGMTAVAKAGVGLAAALTATVLTVSWITERYIKKLVGINYIDKENDIYDEED